MDIARKSSGPCHIQRTPVLHFQDGNLHLPSRAVPHLGTFSSVQFSHLVMSSSLRPHGLQHARLPCPSPSPGAYSNSCPWSQWCHPTISSSIIPFSSHLQSFPASGSFPVSQVLCIRWPKYWSFSFSISPSILPVNIQDWFPLGLTGWISLQPKGLSRVFFNTTVQKHQFFSTQPSSQSNFTSICDHRKNHSLD